MDNAQDNVGGTLGMKEVHFLNSSSVSPNAWKTGNKFQVRLVQSSLWNDIWNLRLHFLNRLQKIPYQHKKSKVRLGPHRGNGWVCYKFSCPSSAISQLSVKVSVHFQLSVIFGDLSDSGFPISWTSIDNSIQKSLSSNQSNTDSKASSIPAILWDNFCVTILICSCRWGKLASFCDKYIFAVKLAS